MRWVELATDYANSNYVILHALDILQEHYDNIIVLQPASPLRKAKDIEDALEQLDPENAPAVFLLDNLTNPFTGIILLKKTGGSSLYSPARHFQTKDRNYLQHFSQGCFVHSPHGFF